MLEVKILKAESVHPGVGEYVTLKGDKGDKGDSFTYDDFTPEQLESLRGPQGIPGLDGVDGKDGAPGKDGTSATHSWNGTVLTITSASGTSSADLKGDKGEQGIPGPAGEPGPAGSDANVTAENIESALGYTPADSADVAEKLTAPSTAAVGQIFQIKSINEDGSLTLEAVDMPTGNVKDVQVNGTTVVADGIANIPAAKNGKYGVIRTLVSYGVDVGTSGQLMLVKAENSVIDGRSSNYRAIVPQNLDYAVKAAMCDGKGTAWTDVEQAAARTRMGAVSATDVSAAITEALSAIGIAEEGSY